MIRIFEEKNIPKEEILSRAIASYPKQEAAVREILADVAERGDDALLDYTEKFDGVRPASLIVTGDEIEQAWESVDPHFIEILQKAKENIEIYHRKQIRAGFTVEREDGIVLGQKITPIGKAGLYIPGGTASYPSTVLMNAIPAKIAGVSQIVMTTPPGRDGKIKSEILAAAKLCGVDRIVRCGGAQAIGALAYGTRSVPKVDKIVGPGNIYVAIAKKLVFGTVSIDMIAGPSEILVLADKNSDPVYVAADLLSQAEHDRLATAVLVTDSPGLACAVRDELERQIPTLARGEIARESIDTNGKIIITESLEQAVETANLIAPEHLELCVNDPFALLDRITNAGSVFLGRNTPEPVGDYFAGPNHTLPTGGSARFSSALSVDDFIKKSQYLYYTQPALEKAYADIAEFARHEGLTAHAAAVELRFADRESQK